MSEFYCLWCLFLLETAEICNYLNVFRVSLKSAPSNVNAMRPGSIYWIEITPSAEYSEILLQFKITVFFTNIF